MLSTFLLGCQLLGLRLPAGPVSHLGLVAGLSMAAAPFPVLPPTPALPLALSHEGSEATVTMHGQALDGFGSFQVGFSSLAHLYA